LLAVITGAVEDRSARGIAAAVGRLISAGRLPAGTRLPTVRALAAGLGLAVNTVARAYKELEADGLVATEGRRGTRVTGGVPTPAAVRDAAAELALQARRAGLTLPEATRLLEEGWSR
jgi:DNA-binding transcriptional regulator YhcF (GntR family)